MRDPAALAEEYEADAADAPLQEAPRERWPIMWTILFAVAASAALWALIFAAVGALWALLSDVHG
jgi:hypothetical protein